MRTLEHSEYNVDYGCTFPTTYDTIFEHNLTDATILHDHRKTRTNVSSEAGTAMSELPVPSLYITFCLNRSHVSHRMVSSQLVTEGSEVAQSTVRIVIAVPIIVVQATLGLWATQAPIISTITVEIRILEL